MTPRVSTARRAGKVLYQIACRDCPAKLEAPDKAAVKRKWKDHDRAKHRPERERAKRTAKAAARAEKSRSRKIARDLAAAERKASAAEARQAAAERREKAKREAESARPVKPSSGLRTKGIPGVPDGQKVTGVVYDNQNRPVPYEKIRRYVQGW